jgi:hypothetical protein
MKKIVNEHTLKHEKETTSINYEFDDSAENNLFGTPTPQEIGYYTCIEHGKLLASKIKWVGNIPICPKCGKYCNLFEDPRK